MPRSWPFIQAHKDRRIEPFKTNLFRGWFESWPEETELFGKDWKKGLDDRRLAQIELHSQNTKTITVQSYPMAIKWQGHLVTIIWDFAEVLQEGEEGYEAFKAQVDKEVLDTMPANESKEDFNKRKMTIYCRWRSLAWEMESSEVKAEIDALWNEKNTPEGNAPDDDGDENEAQVIESFQGSVDELGEAVTSFLRELHEETGWAFTVLGGGLNHEGEVKMVVTHVGKTTSGKTFPHICDKYQENVLQEYLNFVNIRHPIEECLLCAQVHPECKKTPTSQDTEAPGTRGDGGSQTTPTNKGKRGQKKCDNKDGSAIPEDVTENTTSMTAPKNAAEHSQTTDERLASPIPPSD
ncbi:hypothetical protein JOM56_011634 [Amanita muscaria]